MRRPTTVELMLLATILLWALNLSVTKYILDHGLEPLSYATIRYALAGAIFVVLTLVAERSLRIERRHVAGPRIRRRDALAQPAVVRLRARHDDGVDDRAAARRDPDLRGAASGSLLGQGAADGAGSGSPRRSRSRASRSSRSARAATSPAGTRASCSASRPARRGRPTRSPSRRSCRRTRRRG